MQPHPPSSEKLTPTRGSSKRRPIKFPGKGESLTKKTYNAVSSRSSKSASFSKSIASLTVKGNSTDKQSEVAKQDINLEFKKRSSFSVYRTLPAIVNDKEKTKKTAMRKSATSNKRVVFPNGKLDENEIDTPPDEIFLKSMKKMKLGKEHLLNNVSNVQCNMPSNEKNTYCINLIIRTVDGSKLQHVFLSNNTLGDILKYLTTKLKTDINLTKHVLFMNNFPKVELKKKHSTLETLGIKDRTVLTLDIRD